MGRRSWRYLQGSVIQILTEFSKRRSLGAAFFLWSGRVVLERTVAARVCAPGTARSICPKARIISALSSGRCPRSHLEHIRGTGSIPCAKENRSPGGRYGGVPWRRGSVLRERRGPYARRRGYISALSSGGSPRSHPEHVRGTGACRARKRTGHPEGGTGAYRGGAGLCSGDGAVHMPRRRGYISALSSGGGPRSHPEHVRGTGSIPCAEENRSPGGRYGGVPWRRGSVLRERRGPYATKARIYIRAFIRGKSARPFCNTDPRSEVHHTSATHTHPGTPCFSRCRAIYRMWLRRSRSSRMMWSWKDLCHRNGGCGHWAGRDLLNSLRYD